MKNISRVFITKKSLKYNTCDMCIEFPFSIQMTNVTNILINHNICMSYDNCSLELIWQRFCQDDIQLL